MPLLHPLVSFFLPAAVRRAPTHPRYAELYAVANACLFGLPLVLVGAGLLRHFGLAAGGFYAVGALAGATLLSLRWLGHYRLPMSLTALTGLYVIHGFVQGTGWLFSPNVNLLHVYVVLALLADKRYGGYTIPCCLGLLGYIYYQTPAAPPGAGLTANPAYLLALHAFTTVFLGGALAYGAYTDARNQRRIQQLQTRRISLLDQAVQQRTAQLSTMRQTLAADFHDETGNVLAAITRQAAVLELQLGDLPELLPLVRSISDHSTQLYATSKDFLWDLNHPSDQPDVLFHYLTAYGQQFYNQFDIAFSAELRPAAPPAERAQLAPAAARHLIYIFKEAMSNVVKHAGATDVVLELALTAQAATFALLDNGRWTEPAPHIAHYGLQNMRQRCQKNNFRFGLLTGPAGTRLEVVAPVAAVFLTESC